MELLQNNPSATLEAIRKITGALASAISAITPGVAMVAPVLFAISAILQQVSNAAANPGLVAALA